MIKYEGIKLQEDKVTRSLKEDEEQKYLGILQADQIKLQKMKEKVKNEYKRRVRKILGLDKRGETTTIQQEKKPFDNAQGTTPEKQHRQAVYPKKRRWERTDKIGVIGLERYINNSEERLLSAGKRIWRRK